MFVFIDCFSQNIKNFKGVFLKFRITEYCGNDCFEINDICFYINDQFGDYEIPLILNTYKKNKKHLLTKLLSCPIICTTEFIVKNTVQNREIDTSFIMRYDSINNFNVLDEFYLESANSNYKMKYSASFFRDSIFVILSEIDDKWYGCHKVKMSNFGYLYIDYRDKDRRFFYFPTKNH